MVVVLTEGETAHGEMVSSNIHGNASETEGASGEGDEEPCSSSALKSQREEEEAAKCGWC